MTREHVEEILEAVWLSREDGWVATPASVLLRAHGEICDADFDEAEAEGLLRTVEGRVTLLPDGEERAGEIVRRHRLAERLLTDLLQVSDQVVETSACRFEHFLTPEVTDSICTLLGHPTVCPHNRPIPSGLCCSRLAKEIGPVVRRLSDVTVGEKVRIVFIASEHEKRFERLGALGVHPGSVVRLFQRRPSFILEVDQTTLAVEREVAEGIYVRRWTPENGE